MTGSGPVIVSVPLMWRLALLISEKLVQ